MQNADKITLNTFMIIFYAILVSLFYAFSNTFLKLLGAGAIVVALILSFFVFLINFKEHSLNPLFFIVLFIFVLLVGRLFIVYNFTPIYESLQVILTLMFFAILQNQKINKNIFNKIKGLFKIIFYVMIITYSLFFIIGKIDFINNLVSATILKILFPLSMFAIDFSKKGLKIFLQVLLTVAVHFILGERTASLCFVFAYIATLFFSKKRSSSTYYLIFLLVICVVIAFPFIYVWFSEHPLGIALNGYVHSKTGENFFSGRNRIWKAIIDGLENKWLFGAGFGNQILKDAGIDMSTHNLYMYALLNGGIVLLLLLVLFFFFIWRGFIKYAKRGNKTANIAISYILALLLFCDFELFMITNNLLLSLIWWFSIAVFMMKLREKEKTRRLLYSVE